MAYGNIVVIGAIFFIIMFSIQYSINKVIVLLQEIREILSRMER